MTGRTFVCEHCQGHFTKGRSDDEAMAESKDLWGNVPTEDLAVICDDCYQRFMAWWTQLKGSGEVSGPVSDGAKAILSCGHVKAVVPAEKVGNPVRCIEPDCDFDWRVITGWTRDDKVHLTLKGDSPP